MKKQIPKPENWQDFEELCKILWGEVWDCNEIKKNGRSGQDQHGVDIYGIPQNETQYFGIQCKGKDEYTKAKLSKKEIGIEIEKALLFRPKLKKLYFATTANKDSKIEEFVRVKNIENIKKGLFEVHLFCWEDIAYYIEQNKRANEWYIKKQNFATNFQVVVSFKNNTNKEIFSPILLKNHIRYNYQEDKMDYANMRYYKGPETMRKERLEIDTETQPVRYFLNGTSNNKSSCVFSIRLKNIGNLQLENFKLFLSFNDDFFTTERVWKQQHLADLTKYEYNIKWNKGTIDLELKNSNEILVPNDELLSDKICLRPNIEYPFCLKIPWKLVSKDYTESGFLFIELNTTVKEKNSVVTYSKYFPNEVILQNYTGPIDE